MDTSERSHEAPMTFNVVSWKGVLMPEVKEPIRVLRLIATQKVSSQISYAWHLFYLGKSLFACNRWNHGKLKPKCDVPRKNLPWEKPFTEVCVTAPIAYGWCVIETSSDLVRSSSTILGKCSETFVLPSEQFCKISGNLQKVAKIFGKSSKTASSARLFNKKNITR